MSFLVAAAISSQPRYDRFDTSPKVYLSRRVPCRFMAGVGTGGENRVIADGRNHILPQSPTSAELAQRPHTHGRSRPQCKRPARFSAGDCDQTVVYQTPGAPSSHDIAFEGRPREAERAKQVLLREAERAKQGLPMQSYAYLPCAPCGLSRYTRAALSTAQSDPAPDGQPAHGEGACSWLPSPARGAPPPR